MAYIKVDHSLFRKTADAVENYLKKRKKDMQIIDHTVISLNASWQGEDYDRLKKEWTEMNSAGSASEKTSKALSSYKDALNEAGTRYREAQERAINRANILCN